MELQKSFHTFGMELLGCVLSGAGAVAGFLLQFIGAAGGVRSDGGTVPSDHVRLNPVWYGIGAVLCVCCFAVVWRLMLRKTLLEILREDRSMLLVWILLALRSLAVQIILFWFISMLMTAFLNAVPSAWTTGFALIYPFYVTVFIIVDMLLHNRQTT